MFRRSPLLGAAAIYGVSRAATRRENEREFERRQQMEWEMQRRDAKRQEDERMRRAERDEERRRAEREEDRARAEREEQRRRTEQEEQRRRADWDRDRQLLAERQLPGPPVLMQATSTTPNTGPETAATFCGQCGNPCRQQDKFCSRCGASVAAANR